MISDPKKGADQAREAWNRLKNQLKQKLAEVDTAAVALRVSWSNYNATAESFMNDRTTCVPKYFIETCFRLILKERNLGVIDANRALVLPDDVMVYNIYDKTVEMHATVKDFHDKLEAAYEREVEYGAMLGLNSAGQAKRSGKSLDEVVDSMNEPEGDNPGTMRDGSDDADIIKFDHQEYSNGKWKWK